MRITAIHKVIRYIQAAIFKDYINDNSAKRQAATSEFEKDLHKLLNNALFGKTMENVRGRKKYNLRNSKESMLKDTGKPHYLHSHRFAEYLVLNEIMNMEVKLNKPIFIGQAVLDLSKLIMFELRYRKFPAYEAEFGGSITVVGSDTDSLFCFIENISLNEHSYIQQWRGMDCWTVPTFRAIIHSIQQLSRPSWNVSRMRLPVMFPQRQCS